MKFDNNRARTLARFLAVAAIAAVGAAAYGAGADLGQAQKQATNWTRRHSSVSSRDCAWHCSRPSTL